MRRIVLLFGPPGIGKGTVGASLSEKWHIPLISTGDLLREQVKCNTSLGEHARAFMERGELVPDELVVEVLHDRVSQKDAKDGFILDGFPRTLKQAEMLEGVFLAGDERIILNLEGSPAVLIERLSQRRICSVCGAVYHMTNIPPKQDDICDFCGGALVRRPDDEPAVIEKRLRVFAEETKPILDFYRGTNAVYTINADGTLPETLQEIDRIVKWS